MDIILLWFTGMFLEVSPASNDYSIEGIKTKSDRNGRFCLMPVLLL